MSGEQYVYLWEYRVPKENAAAFERLYGPEGAWVALFRQAPGYLGTTLYRDRRDPGRYLTVDRWVNEAAYREFRERFAGESARIDVTGDALTARETALGSFEPVL